MSEVEEGPSVSVTEFAKYAGVSRRTVIRWIKSGRIPSYKRANGYHRIPFGVVENLPVTASRFAELLGVTRRTVVRWCAAGTLYAWRRPGSDVWEIAAGEVDAFGYRGSWVKARTRAGTHNVAPEPMVLREWGRNPMIFAAQRRVELKERKQLEDEVFGGRAPKARIKPPKSSSKHTAKTPKKAGSDGSE
jgi:excisionase family DNA binding protein